MARPKEPLISPSAAIEVALRLIDDEGLDAFSMRRLGRELGVNGASLYHHFADKDEILAGVVLLVLGTIRTPPTTGTWQTWFMAASKAYREALLSHPNVAPLLLDRHQLRFGREVMDLSARQLADGGMPDGWQLAVMEAGELLAFASALFTSRAPAGGGFGPISAELPALQEAVDANDFDADEAFELTCRAMVAGFAAAIEWQAPIAPRPSRQGAGGRRRAGGSAASMD